MKPFAEHIQRKLKRLEQGQHLNAWSAVSLVGSIGLILMLPLMIGTYLGWWLDGKYQQGPQSWTLVGILLGLAAGVYLLYQQLYWPLQKQRRDQENDIQKKNAETRESNEDNPHA